jgi:excisionase family DNA binding protein
MKYTLGQAAKEVGVSKPTISRAIKNQDISAKKRKDGSYEIDASELHRWHDDYRSRKHQVVHVVTPESDSSNSALQAEVQRLKEQLDTVNLERDRERQQLTDQIEDLRDRLDKEAEERRGLSQRLLEAPEQLKKRRWWSF